MRAVIMAADEGSGIAPLNERYPACLLPLVDRPFIQHIVEQLAVRGVKQFDWVLGHFPEKIEEHLGDGSRWGCQFTYHLVRDTTRPYRLLKIMSFADQGEEPILLGHADRLPLSLALDRSSSTAPGPVFYGLQAAKDGNGTSQWTGWVMLTAEHIASLPADVDEAGLQTHLMKLSGPAPAWSPVETLLAFRTFHEILAAHHVVLHKESTGWALVAPEYIDRLPDDPDEAGLKNQLLRLRRPTPVWVPLDTLLPYQTFPEVQSAHASVIPRGSTGLLQTGREVEPGVWLSRNVVLHPTARVTAPVYVGENCQVSAGVRLGPDAVIGNGCVLDSHCSVTNSVIFPGSYVGEALELEDVLVDKNRLINAHVGAAVTITDIFILGSLTENHFVKLLTSLLSRLFGLVLLVPAGPVLLLTALWLKLFRTGPVLIRKEVVRLPAPPEEEMSWRTYQLWSFKSDKEGATGVNRPIKSTTGDLLLRVLPALVNIARGELGFAGVPPRSREEIQALSRDWRSLYLHSKAGIITEAFIRCGPRPTEDQLYTAEGFYAVMASWKHDLGLVLRFVVRACFGFLWADRVVQSDVSVPAPRPGDVPVSVQAPNP